MRISLLVIAAATLGACTTAPQPQMRSAKAEAHLQELLAGKVAGSPVLCLPNRRSNDMVVIDENTVVFRDGPRVYRNDLQGGGCSLMGTGHYALLTRLYGSANLCRGQIAEVVDVANGMTVGSCVMGDFVPYARPRG